MALSSTLAKTPKNPATTVARAVLGILMLAQIGLLGRFGVVLRDRPIPPSSSVVASTDIGTFNAVSPPSRDLAIPSQKALTYSQPANVSVSPSNLTMPTLPPALALPSQQDPSMAALIAASRPPPPLTSEPLVNPALRSPVESLASQPPQVAVPPPPPGLSSGTTTEESVPSLLPPGREIKNPTVAKTVEGARAVSRKGDKQMAMEALRQADLMEPNHPEILSEMALIYEAMAIDEKAKSLWHRVVAMGEASAGGYYFLAQSRLRTSSPSQQPSAQEITPTVDSSAKPILLGKCEMRKDPSVTQGEKYTLRIPVLPIPGQKVDPSTLDAQVFVFDQFADGHIGPTIAQRSPARWNPAVPDWTDPKGAVVETDWFMPEQTEEFTKAHGGPRKILGYMVKLFYDNTKLAGQKADPVSLLNFNSESALPAGADSSLFPRN